MKLKTTRAQSDVPTSALSPPAGRGGAVQHAAGDPAVRHVAWRGGLGRRGVAGPRAGLLGAHQTGHRQRAAAARRPDQAQVGKPRRCHFKKLEHRDGAGLDQIVFLGKCLSC